jgi:hypothetical protein
MKDETIENARKELEVMKQVLDALEPLEPAARFRALAAAAARFGLYEIARRALDAAQRSPPERRPTLALDDKNTP